MKCYLSLLFCLVVVLLNGQPDPSLEGFLQKRQIPTQSTPEGLHYIVEQQGSGAFAAEGDYVLIRYKGSLPEGAAFDSSEQEEPFIFKIGNREVVKGLDLGIRLLKKGGKAILYLPASLGYQQFGVEGSVPPNSPLIYEVELLDIMDFDHYDHYMRAQEERAKLRFEQRKKEQFRNDMLTIETYAAQRQLKTRRTASGLSYVVSKVGKGPVAKSGNHLKISYKSYLPDGTLIEESVQPFEFVLGTASVIQGLEEGLQFFNKGSEGWLLIPSGLAYGSMRIKNIPANSVLIFEIKVLELK